MTRGRRVSHLDISNGRDPVGRGRHRRKGRGTVVRESGRAINFAEFYRLAIELYRLAIGSCKLEKCCNPTSGIVCS